ncbi:MAG: hypothetical protein R2939_21690 [Kofleriaceae bacterium]
MHSPAYVPTYLMFGTTLTEAGDRTRAAEILTASCAVARAAGDRHALGELEGARRARRRLALRAPVERRGRDK